MPDIDWDDDAGPVIPLLLLPSQTSTRSLCECGCERLLLETLQNAIDALQYQIAIPTAQRPAAYAEAKAWFMTPNLDVCINLADVCAGLGLDVKQMQRHVLPVVRRRTS